MKLHPVFIFLFLAFSSILRRYFSIFSFWSSSFFEFIFRVHFLSSYFKKPQMDCRMCLIVGREVFIEQGSVCLECMTATLASIVDFEHFDQFVCDLLSNQLDFEASAVCLLNPKRKAKGGAVKKLVIALLHELSYVCPSPETLASIGSRLTDLERIYSRLHVARNKFKIQLEMARLQNLNTDSPVRSYRPVAQIMFRNECTTSPKLLAQKSQVNKRQYDDDP